MLSFVSPNQQRKNIRGSIDRYASSIQSPTIVEKKKQQTINDAFAKEMTQYMHRYLLRLRYENEISLQVLNSDNFIKFVEAVG